MNFFISIILNEIRSVHMENEFLHIDTGKIELIGSPKMNVFLESIEKEHPLSKESFHKIMDLRYHNENFVLHVCRIRSFRVLREMAFEVASGNSGGQYAETLQSWLSSQYFTEKGSSVQPPKTIDRFQYTSLENIKDSLNMVVESWRLKSSFLDNPMAENKPNKEMLAL